MYMTSGGETTRIEKAKKLLRSALIGLVIVLASFTIAQFIVNTVSQATSTDVTGGCDPAISDCSGNYFPPPIPKFSLKPPTSILQCASGGIRNLKLPFSFSRAVKEAPIMTGGGIRITKIEENIVFTNGVKTFDAVSPATSVAGTFAVEGKKVTFTPSGDCPAPNGTLKCFEANATYHVMVDKQKVKSTAEYPLTCTEVDGVDPCDFEFSTGVAVDTEPPSEVLMTAPNPLTVVQDGTIEPLQASTKDDVGVSSVNFYAVDDQYILFPAELSGANIKSLTADPLLNLFNTDASEWNTAGLATNKTYPVWAVGADCAGNEKTSPKVAVMLRAENCGNNEKNDLTPYFETGVDCGGTNKTSQYYCGLCPNDVCTSNAECASGFCAIPTGKTEGVCKDLTVIKSVSPDDGAPKNLITITGTGFGTDTENGKIWFTGAGGSSLSTAAYSCGFKCVGGTDNGNACASLSAVCAGGGTCKPLYQWSPNQIVVKVPDAAVDGPIKVEVPAAGAIPLHSDTTNDAVGPIMNDFDVNLITRPGLCSLVSDPATALTEPFTKGAAGSVLKLKGLLFGTTQGSSTVYLNNFEAKVSSNPSVAANWNNVQISTIVPNVDDGLYDTQVYSGTYHCLNASGVATATVCSSNNDCTTLPDVKCATSWCSQNLSLYCSSSAQCQTKTVTTCSTKNDAKCIAANAEYCDVTTGLCVKDEGECTDIRVGSNPVKFKATHVGDESGPVITAINSGWKSCVGNGSCTPYGNNAVKICGKNSAKTCTTDDNCDEGITCDYWYRFCSISKRSCGFDTDPVCTADEGTCTYHSPGYKTGGGALNPSDAGFCQNTGAKYFHSCDQNSDCDVGDPVCTVLPTTGPSGQYVTISGSGFGPSVGSVKFANTTFGTLSASTDFPAACGNAFWTDNSIVVKVPYDATDKLPLNPATADQGKFSVTVQAGSKTSVAYKDLFQVLGDTQKPTPGICAMSPSVGPAGAATAVPVTFVGENLGAFSGTEKVTFSSAAAVTPGTWTDAEETENGKQKKISHVGIANVPAGSTTGPVFVTDSKLNQSNPLTFKVGNCKTDTSIVCPMVDSVQQLCCANGSCANTCNDFPKLAQFAYKLSTNAIPVAPTVVTRCAAKEVPVPSPIPVASPSPSQLWSKPESVCLNAAVTATFSVDVDSATLTDTNVFVQKCGTEADGKCVKYIDAHVAGTFAAFGVTNVRTFQWSPSPVFERNTLYQVTLRGASSAGPDGGIRSKSLIANTNQVSMANDFVWEFRTADSSQSCIPGDVNVSPTPYTSTQPGTQIGYLASLTSKTDPCIILSCTGHSIAWENNQNGSAKFVSDTGSDVNTLNPAAGICSATVNPIHDTFPSPMHITAKTTPAGGSEISGFGNLTINSTEPRIKARFPDCSQVCPNVKPWVQFNVKMNQAKVESSFASGKFKLYKCDTPACNISTSEDVTSTIVDKVEYKEFDASGVADGRAYLNFKSGQELTLDTSYRIVIGPENPGSLLMSYFEKAMLPKGSNYNNPIADPSNLIVADSYSWKFRTKPSDVSCGVDHVEIMPKDAVLSYVGQHQEYYGTIHGIPDDCSAVGQTLQDADLDWTWNAADDPNKAGDTSMNAGGTNDSQITAFMIKRPTSGSYGQIKLASSTLPAYCSSNCLLTGTPSAVCGNGGTAEYGEACDNGANNGKIGNGCSSACLLTGVNSAYCGNNVVDYGEACDDGNIANNDGCHSDCKKEGAVAPSCGVDSTINANETTGAGEACDNGTSNGTSGNNCSKICLLVGNATSGTGSNQCGNNTIDTSAGEECDLGANNGKSGSGCSSICLKTGSAAPICIGKTGGLCNDNNNVSGDGCSSACLYEGSSASSCGNGTLETAKGEACDDGVNNGKSTSGCTTKCLYKGSGAASCGNGGSPDHAAGEECDDNNKANGDGCSAICLLEGVKKPVCGENGIENGESCDDGNKVNGDGCSSICLKEGAVVSTCGNKKIDKGESCDDGNIVNNDGCSSVCLNQGSTSPAVCGDKKVEKGEDCDDGNVAINDGCSSVCLWEGSAPKTEVCGDGAVTVANGEECDDGGNQNGDGCSSVCLKEGSKAYGKICGNGTVDANAATKAGEACDDNNIVNGDGCSNNCLWEGSSSVVVGTNAICGNHSDDNGEDAGCDTATGIAEGCSNRCLKKGSSALYSAPSVCGDNAVGTGEQCDDHNTVDGDGCSSTCLKEGSSIKYSSPSFCRDGVVELEEAAACELNVGSVKTGGYAVAEIAAGGPNEVDTVAKIQPAGLLDNPNYGYAISKVTASVPGQLKNTIPSTLSLHCSCESDAACGSVGGVSLGCGTNKCCFERPTIEADQAPAANAPNVCRNAAIYVKFSQAMEPKSFGSPAETTVPNLQLELVSTKDANFDGTISLAEAAAGVTSVVASNCPYYPLHVGFAPTHNLFARVWNAIVRFFGQPALALTDTPYTGSTKCFVPLSYQQDFTHKVHLGYAKALLPVSTYKVTIKTKTSESDKGVLSTNQVGVSAAEKSYQFTTGDDICLLDVVKAVDNGISTSLSPYESLSPGYYSKTNEVHGFTATPYAVRGVSLEEIISIQGTYSWTWGWASSAPAKVCKGGVNAGKACTDASLTTVCGNVQGTTCENNVTSKILGVDGVASTTTSSLFKALGNNGTEDVIATATIDTATNTIDAKVCSNDAKKTCVQNSDCGGSNTCVVPPRAVSGIVPEVAFLCSNPWPALDKYNEASTPVLYGVPYKDSSDDHAVGAINANFSMFYCKDAGQVTHCSTGDRIGSACVTNADCKKKTTAGTDGICALNTDDDLKTLTLPPTISTPASKSIHTDILKEFVFNVEGTKDSIGIRVLKNQKYLSALAWFKDQGFSDSPKPLKLDGYDAVQSGSTIYVAAANRVNSVVYSNIYAISYNADAGQDAQKIFDLLLQNFRFNANADTDPLKNVSNVGLCKVAAGYSHANANPSDSSSPFISCSMDEDCIDKCQADGTCSISGNFCPGGVGCSGSSTYGICDADKQKLARDLKRLQDVTQMVSIFEKYGSTHGHCAVTKAQSCVVYNNASAAPFHNPTCPGTETCYPGYPTVQSGTFVPSMSNSKWPSWNSALANAVGTALPTDPLNQFFGQCKITDYDSATCWNGKEGKFTCPVNSHIYGYQNQGGGSYVLSTELEYNKVPWNDSIQRYVCSNDPSVTCTDAAIDCTGTATCVIDHGVVKASYQTAPTGTLPTGFVSGSSYCNAATFGNSNLCGDGVKSGSATSGQVDFCEIGNVQSVDCFVNNCTAGTTNNIGKTCANNTDCGTGGACSSTTKLCTAGTTNNIGHVCSNLGSNITDCGSAGVCAVTAQPGKINVTCNNTCTLYQTVAEARLAGAFCKPLVCGNGIKDTGEICDDGALNGTYGHCGLDCTLTNVVACGDGTLAGNEECDCGNTDTKRTAGGWSSQKLSGICSVINGGYSTSATPSCSADCKENGPYCGDKVVNGDEQCDGGSQTYAGKFCVDGVTQCTKDSDCTPSTSGSCGSGSGTKKDTTYHEACGQDFICLAGDAALIGTVCTADTDCKATGGVCSNARHCVGGTNVNAPCTSNATCTGNGICSTTSKYDLTRTRICINPPTANACMWAATGSGWSACQGGPQHCGNGQVEGMEVCDDGNTSNNDACLNSCQKNSCGDNFVQVGIESCDAGQNNKVDTESNKCGAAYGSTCNYCNTSCQYKTETGAYCGDGTINGDEFCDGSKIMPTCAKLITADEMVTSGSCDPRDIGIKTVDASGTGKKANNGVWNVSATWQGTTKCPQDYQCEIIGTCNGGGLRGETGKKCGAYLNNCDGYCKTPKPIDNTCNWAGDCCANGWDDTNNKCNPGTNYGPCLSAGQCVLPTCASNCGSTCPESFQKINVQVQGNVQGASATSSIDLYSLANGTKTPDRANLLLPACRVGVGLSADVSSSTATGINATVIANTNYDSVLKKYDTPQTTTPASVLEIGNGIKINLPTAFICQGSPFAIPFTTTFTSSGTTPGTVNFKNFQFEYCPL